MHFVFSVPEFLDRYYSHPLYTDVAKDYEFVSARCYDHIWLASLGLNCTDQKLKEIGNKWSFKPI